MPLLKDIIIGILQRRGELTDRELTDAIFGLNAGPQTINGECNHLENLGVLIRRKAHDGVIRNVLVVAGDGPTLRVVK